MALGCSLPFPSRQADRKITACPTFSCELNTELSFHLRAGGTIFPSLAAVWGSHGRWSFETFVEVLSQRYWYMSNHWAGLHIQHTVSKNMSKMPRAVPVDKGTGCFGISEGFPSGSGDLVTIQKGFGEALTGLQLSCLCCGAKTPDPSCCQVIHNS